MEGMRPPAGDLPVGRAAAPVFRINAILILEPEVKRCIMILQRFCWRKYCRNPSQDSACWSRRRRPYRSKPAFMQVSRCWHSPLFNYSDSSFSNPSDITG